jgi:hypothetical protein
MDRSAWLKTPYANTSAKDPDSAITSLLQNYGVKKWATMHDVGPGGLPGFGVRFELQGLWYVVQFESLQVKGVDPKQLLNQVKRVVYYTIKTSLEASSVFISPQKLLFAFLEMNGGNLYEQVAPHLQELQQQPQRFQLLLPTAE